MARVSDTMTENPIIKVSSATQREDALHKLYTPWLLLVTFISVFGSSLLMGYNIGVLNSPAKIILSFYNETYIERNGEPYDDSILNLLWAVTVSIFVCGGMAGGFSTGLFADKLGRKKAMLVNQSFMLIGVFFEVICKWAKAPELLIVGRIFTGFSSGIVQGMVSLYLAEVSPQKIRGTIGSCHQLAVTIGILLSQVMGLHQTLGTKERWPILLGLTAVPSLISCAVLPFCPESPRYLLLKHNNEKAAVAALTKLRGTSNVSREIDEMVKESKESMTAGVKFSFPKLFSTRELRKPLFIAILMQIAQQWSGINAIFYYSAIIFEGAGIPTRSIPYAVVGTGVVNVLTTAISLFLVEIVGRRSLLLGPMSLMAGTMLLITISLNLQAMYSWMAYISVTCIILYILGFALGLGSIPPLICAELFRQEPRPAAMAIAQGVNWTCNFILAMCFPFMQSSLQAYTFLVFLVILMISVVLFFLLVPETKNLTFDEIARALASGRPASNVPQQTLPAPSSTASTTGLLRHSVSATSNCSNNSQTGRDVELEPMPDVQRRANFVL